jgi:hypothetical protein
MSDLEKKLDALIAEADHVRPEDVTLEYVRQTRNRNTNVTYDCSTMYGGFNRRNGRVLSPSQSAEIISAAYRFLKGFASK